MKKFIVLLFIVFLAGCASAPPALSPEVKATFQNLKTAKIAVKYSLATKKINYLETLYRVLWLETKTSSQDFSGIWEPDADLTKYVSETLDKQGYAVESVYDMVSDASIIESENKTLASGCLENSAGNHPEIKGVKIIPVQDYFMQIHNPNEFSALSNQLKERNFKYLLELISMDIYGNAIGFGGVAVQTFPNARIIDLDTNRVVWSRQLGFQEVYQLGGDLKKLEADQMSKTKEGLRSGISKMKVAELWPVTN